ncbi:MAG: hypothetical protein AAGI30_07005 [Planctomycetota bacterium]
MQLIANVLFALGVLSIPAAWLVFHGHDRDFGLFMGLWPPTLLLLSTRCELLCQFMTLQFTSMGQDFGSGGQWRARSSERRARRDDGDRERRGKSPDRRHHSEAAVLSNPETQTFSLEERSKVDYDWQDTVDLSRPPARQADDPTDR